MLVSAKAMLQSAEKGHYGIGAFNENNLEWAASILDAAEELQSPVIIQCTGGAAKWQVSYSVVADMVRRLVEDKNITVPVALHLDHGSYEDAFKCIEAGFTSIMYDGSHEADFETNLKRTEEVVKAAHAKGISVVLLLRVSLQILSSAQRLLLLVLTSLLAVLVTFMVSTQLTGRACLLTSSRLLRSALVIFHLFFTVAPAFL